MTLGSSAPYSELVQCEEMEERGRMAHGLERERQTWRGEFDEEKADGLLVTWVQDDVQAWTIANSWVFSLKRPSRAVVGAVPPG